MEMDATHRRTRNSGIRGKDTRARLRTHNVNGNDGTTYGTPKMTHRTIFYLTLYVIFITTITLIAVIAEWRI